MTSPIVQYPRDQILQSDKDMGWKVSVPDEMPLQGPFIINASLKVEMNKKSGRFLFFLILMVKCLKQLHIKLMLMQGIEFPQLCVAEI